MWDKEWVWAREFCEELLRQAAQRHLAEQAIQAAIEEQGSKTPGLSQRTALWIGQRLVTWGTQLQITFGDGNEPCR